LEASVDSAEGNGITEAALNDGGNRCCMSETGNATIGRSRRMRISRSACWDGTAGGGPKIPG